jgi:hypothetical protein
MRKTVAALLAAYAACAWVGTAEAAVTYSYFFDSPTYFAAPGSKQSVNVYLQEVVGSGGTSVLAPSGVGMFSLGTMIRWDDAPTPASPATVLATSDITANAAFDQIFKNVHAADATLNDVALANPFAHGTQTAADVYQILIGTFALTAGTNSGEVTHLRATAYGGSNTVNVTGGGAALDGSIADMTATITTALRGDANLDGSVNGSDLNTVLSNYNQNGLDWAHGDFNSDATVNGADLNAVLSNYNQSVGLSAAGAAVPEPSALLLGAIAAGALVVIRCRRRPVRRISIRPR